MISFTSQALRLPGHPLMISVPGRPDVSRRDAAPAPPPPSPPSAYPAKGSFQRCSHDRPPTEQCSQTGPVSDSSTDTPSLGLCPGCSLPRLSVLPWRPQPPPPSDLVCASRLLSEGLFPLQEASADNQASSARASITKPHPHLSNLKPHPPSPAFPPRCLCCLPGPELLAASLRVSAEVPASLRVGLRLILGKTVILGDARRVRLQRSLCRYWLCDPGKSSVPFPACKPGFQRKCVMMRYRPISGPSTAVMPSCRVLGHV